MEWLRQNWILLPIILGAFFLLRRGGGGCGHGGGHDKTAHSHEAPVKQDPVSGETVDPATATTLIHEGTTYYFASEENRAKFAAAPHNYVKPSFSHRHHRGCC